ncbi:MAG: NAD(+)/NADH kinase [Bacillota bacterium]|nr:NAD(+)/NADH kinase [Bacillota bacterium]
MRIFIHNNSKSESLKVKNELINFINKSELQIVKTNPELIIVIGGDGTMLSAIRKFRYKKIPFIGINTGTLGFLPSVLPKDIGKFIDIIKNKKYSKVHYPLLELTSETVNGEKISHYAFNEILIKHLQPKLMEAKISFNNKPFNYFTGDGFIISTAIGATGYAIWAGGVATHSSLELYQITPIHPNDNSVNRPLKTSMVVPIDTKLSIDVIKAKKRKVIVACDGYNVTDDYISKISIRKSKDHMITILKTDDYDYFDLYKNKIIDKKIINSL